MKRYGVIGLLFLLLLPLAAGAEESHWRYVERAAAIGHWSYDPQTDRFTFSEGAVRLLGLEENTLEQQALLDMILPEDRRQFQQSLGNLISAQQALNLNMRLRTPKGRIIDLHSQGRFNMENRTFIGVVQDNTPAQEALRLLHFQIHFFNAAAVIAVVILLIAVALLASFYMRRKRAEEALKQHQQELRESHEMTQLILNSAAEGIYGIDLEGVCTFCNESCLALLGFTSQDQLIGRNVHDLIHHHAADGRTQPADQCRLLQHLGEKIQVDDELFWRTDGSSFHAEYWSQPIYREGRLIGAVVTFFDISERKQAQQILQEKNEEVERFVYTISHDLKSPLVTIKSFLGMLREDIADGDDEQITTDIGYIQCAADKMEQLLGALLQLSRVGSLDHEPTTCSVNELVSESLTTLAGSIRAGGVEVVAEDMPQLLHGDRMRIGQIWQNLLENAIKYMGEQSHPRIEMGVAEQQNNPVFFVRDNGMGVARKHQEQIFRLFSQINPETEGSGLGLALVKKIVDTCRGHIWVTSEGEGRGSCFYFTLPAALISEGDERAAV